MADDTTINNNVQWDQTQQTEQQPTQQQIQQTDSTQPIVSEDGGAKPTHWVITVIIKDPQWNEVWQFTAEDGKNIAELAAMHWVVIPVSCWGWVCWVCLCKVEAWKEVVKSDAFNTPLIPLKTDEQWNPEEVLTCIAGFHPEAFNDWKDHTVILQRTY
jgi:ferredoxin